MRFIIVAKSWVEPFDLVQALFNLFKFPWIFYSEKKKEGWTETNIICHFLTKLESYFLTVRNY